MNHLSIKNLHIQYQDLLVLSDFSADFEKGLHWIQGLNGSGKSSLLKSICGINPVSESMVRIMGIDLFKHPMKAKMKLCFVPDKPQIYPFMTGLQYLHFIASIKKTVLSEELHTWLDSMQLRPFCNMAFSKMSFGTRRKFALSTIFIGNPDVILLDEPLNGLDKHSLFHFSEWMSKTKKEKCILVVSHEPHVIAEIKDSITDLDAV